jgi:hypothetical protein
LNIPNTIPNPVSRTSRFVPRARIARLLLLIPVLAVAAKAMDWSVPEQQLARKISAVTGLGTVSLTVENRSSLNRRDVDIIQNGLRSTLAALNVRFATTEPASATAAITLSENPDSYVWVGEIRRGSDETKVVMVSTPRPATSVLRDTVPLSLRKTLLFSQMDPILDVAVLEEGTAALRIAVLDPEKLSLYRMQGGKWQQEQAFEVAHREPWPRDVRGRLIPGADHTLEVYLPGVICRTNLGATLNCRDSDDPWPLAGKRVSIPLNGTFSASRNFFTGVSSPARAKTMPAPQFYSLAAIPKEKDTLWYFASISGETYVVDDSGGRTTKTKWGSDIAGVKTSCGAGWQVLATSTYEGGQDSVRAYEVPDRDPVAVSGIVNFPGPISALWTEASGDSAVAVAKNPETGNYEASRLSVACSQ